MKIGLGFRAVGDRLAFGRHRDVRFVPKADILHCSIERRYSTRRCDLLGFDAGVDEAYHYFALESAASKAARFFRVSLSCEASLALASVPRIVGRSPGKMLASHASLVSRMAALKSRALAGFMPCAIVTRAPSSVSAEPTRALVKPSRRIGVRCTGVS